MFKKASVVCYGYKKDKNDSLIVNYTVLALQLYFC